MLRFKINVLAFIFILSFPLTVFGKSLSYYNYGTITASGAGTIKIKPSGSKLYVAVSIFDKSHKAAYKNLVKTISNIASRLKNNMPVKLIKTAQINISPNKIYSEHQWITNGYNASENLTIKINGNKNTDNAVLYLLKHKSVRENNPIRRGINRFSGQNLVYIEQT